MVDDLNDVSNLQSNHLPTVILAGDQPFSTWAFGILKIQTMTHLGFLDSNHSLFHYMTEAYANLSIQCDD